MKRPAWLAGVAGTAALAAGNPSLAHTTGSVNLASAWLHPLMGADHLIAMVAVGAWSAQLGGRATRTVPAAFLLAMLTGGLVGFTLIDLPAIEPGVALSVLLLGLAIASGGHVATPFAACAVALFGFCHGYLHGYELTVVEQRLLATAGFMTTTAALHIVGLVGANLVLSRRAGVRILRACGAVAAVFGAWLVLRQYIAG